MKHGCSGLQFTRESPIPSLRWPDFALSQSAQKRSRRLPGLDQPPIANTLSSSNWDSKKRKLDYKMVTLKYHTRKYFIRVHYLVVFPCSTISCLDWCCRCCNLAEACRYRTSSARCWLLIPRPLAPKPNIGRC